MKKKQFLKTTLLALTMMFGATTTWADDYEAWPVYGTSTLDLNKCILGNTGEGEAPTNYNSGTQIQNLRDGGYIEFKAENTVAGKYYFMCHLSYVNNTGDGISVTITVTDDDTSTQEFEGTFNGGYFKEYSYNADYTSKYGDYRKFPVNATLSAGRKTIRLTYGNTSTDNGITKEFSFLLAGDVEKEAANRSEINSAISGLTSMDGALTITLTQDESIYDGDINFPGTTQGAHLITIMAADGKKPTWKGTLNGGSSSGDGNGFIFEGIKIMNSASNSNWGNYWSRVGNISQITFNNCEITKDAGTYDFRMTDGQSSKTIGSMTFNNCILHDFGANNNATINVKHQLLSLSIMNCTIYNYNGGYFLLPQTAVTDQAVTYKFNNNTVYNCFNAGQSTQLFQLNAKITYNPASGTGNVVEINDNIFWGRCGEGDGEHKLFRAGVTDYGTLSIKNNVINSDYASSNDFCYSSGALTKTFVATAYAGNIPFADAANNDFTINLEGNSAFAAISSVASPVGNPSTWKYTWGSGAAKAGTVILPYEANIPEGVSAYTLTYTSGDAVSATKITTGVLPANTPVLLNAEKASTPYIFTSTGTVPNAAPVDLTEGALTGFYANTIVDQGYVLQNQGGNLGFYPFKSARTIKPYRAYLNVTPTSAHGLEILFDDGETTGIREVNEVREV